MQDDRTQDALDALADLFLTGLGPQQPEPVAAAPAANGKRAARPSPRRKTAADDLLDGPAPIRLSPKLKPTRGRAEPFSPEDAIPPRNAQPADAAALLDDEPRETPPQPAAEDAAPIADAPYLRLHRGDFEEPVALDILEDPADQAFDEETPQPLSLAPDEPRDAEPAPEEPVRREPAPAPTKSTPKLPPPADREPAQVLVEAVMLGNLPGMGGPWLTQYAQLLAQQDGAVVVLHVGNDEIDAELVEPGEGAEPVRIPADREDLIELLDAMARPEDGGAIKTVLVHLSAAPEPAGLARLMALDTWTILCGADDAAVVGVYRSLKQIVEAEPKSANKRVGLMVMGSDEAASRAGAGRIQSAAASYLHTPVQLIGWQKRMTPANVRQLGVYEHLDAVWPQFVEWLGTLTPPELEVEETPPPKPAAPPPAPTPAARTAPAAPRQRRSSIFSGPLPRPTRPSPVTTIAGPKAARPPAVTPPPSRQPREAATIEAPQQPAVEVAPAPTPAPAPVTPAVAEPVVVEQPVASGRPSLLDLMGMGAAPGTPGIAGGVALEARCPQHPHTQIVLDEVGQLHLLRHAAVGRVVLGTQKPDALPAVREAIMDLLEARRWVAEHLQLLQLTQRQFRIDESKQPMLHLFTDRADLATGLVARLGETLKLHLLQEVRVGVHSTWFCTPLN